MFDEPMLTSRTKTGRAGQCRHFGFWPESEVRPEPAPRRVNRTRENGGSNRCSWPWLC